MDNLKIVSANLVRVIHYGFVGYMVTVPFLPNATKHQLYRHWFLSGYLVGRWCLAPNGGCGFSILESWLRDIPETEGFIHSIVNPIFVIKENDLNRYIFWSTALLGSISVSRYYGFSQYLT